MNTNTWLSSTSAYIYIYNFLLPHTYFCMFVCFSEVLYELPTLKALASSEEEDEVSFSCFARDFSPKVYEIKWLKNNEDVTNKIYEMKTLFKEEKKTVNGTLYHAASFLTVSSSEWTRSDEFTCLFEGKGENNIQRFTNSSVTYINPNSIGK